MGRKKKKLYPCVDQPCVEEVEVQGTVCDMCLDHYQYAKMVWEVQQVKKIAAEQARLEKEQEGLDSREK